MQIIIGIDIGTTSTKAIAFNLAGQVLHAHYQEYPIISPQPTYSEQNPEEVFSAVLKTLQEVIAKTTSNNLLGISFSSAMHSLIAVDQKGKPLTNCLIWADNRSQKQADELQNTSLGLDIYQQTGTPIHPMSPLCKLIWFREHQPELLRQTHKFISIKEYVFFKLFGKYLIDFSVASATGLFSNQNLTWYKPALDLAGISAAQLSEPVSPLHYETILPLAYKQLLGLPNAVPFIIGASDGCLANLGTQATRPGLAALTIGTSGAIRVTASRPAIDVTQRLFSYILTPEQYVVGGPVNNGGLILRWFRDTFASAEKQLALEEEFDPYDIIIKQAEAVPAGAQGLIFLPYLLGERAPIWDAQARGAFFGITIYHTRAHFARALLEGILFGIYEVMQALEETTGPIEVIYANGGFARSAFWVQMLADIFNKKVLLSETFESSAWGAALLGLSALGKMQESEDSLTSLKPVEEYLPNAAKHAVYRQHYKIFATLYPVLKTQMAQLSALQEQDNDL